ncbi:MAG TPA: Crp/Fnr family transcriptional regulator [Allosphingosinicella sp.]
MARTRGAPVELNAFIQRTFSCSAGVAEAIAARAQLRDYRPRAAILRQGEPCTSTFLLVLGTARAMLVTADGRLVQLCGYGPGDLFGALNAAAGAAQVAEVAAIDQVQAAVFRGTDFLALLESHPCVGLTLSRALVRQLGQLTAQMTARTTLSASGRVHAELLRLADAQGGSRISPPPVLSELALRVQSTRETVSRTIGALERRGIIRRDSKALTIVARARLQDMVV